MLLFFPLRFLSALQYGQFLINSPAACLLSAWESWLGRTWSKTFQGWWACLTPQLQINYIFWSDFLAVFVNEASPPLCSSSLPWAIVLGRLPDPHAHDQVICQIGSSERVQAEGWQHGRSLELQEWRADCLPAGDCKAEACSERKKSQGCGWRWAQKPEKSALGIQMAEEDLSVSCFFLILLDCDQL